eukprot:GHVH01012227.1.p1 GENE.GHVH01012227.1~~GHVH01012227.1.p1  ORF type:complete len:248 (+),score=37.03 GHVH01012227.1:120-863(+)
MDTKGSMTHAEGPQPLQLDPEDVIVLLQMEDDQTSDGKLTLTNTNLERCVVYKIKTTAPKDYLVKPSGGMIKPGETETVLLSSSKKGNAAPGKSDRFLIQSFLEDPANPVLVPHTKDLWHFPREFYFDQRIAVEIRASGPTTRVYREQANANRSDANHSTLKSCLEEESPQKTLNETDEEMKSSSVHQRVPTTKDASAASSMPPKVAVKPVHAVNNVAVDDEIQFTPFQVIIIVLFSILLMKIMRIL